MFNSSLRNFKLRFAFYYIFKSTAWITPIFFLFLQKEAKLDLGQILKISGSLMILPFFLDIPLGMLADRIGARLLLAAGTCLQFFSLLGFFILPSTWAYMSYLISIIIAENCYSGAEQAFLRENLVETTVVKEYLKKLNQYFYYITIPCLVAGVLLFQINPFYPLYMQLLSFFAAFVIAIGFNGRTTKTIQSQENTFSVQELGTDIKSVLSISRIVGLILVSIVFASIVQISAKGIQGQIDQFGQERIGFWLGFSYVFANFASGSSLLLWRNIRSVKILSVTTQFTICFFLFFCGLVLMLMQNVIWIAAGFVLLSGVKSIYRPLVSGELIHSLNDLPRMATTLSIVSTLTAIGVAVMHVLSGYLLVFGTSGTLAAIATFAALFWLASWVLDRPQKFTSFSGKINEVILINGVKNFKQCYPTDAQIPDFELVKAIAKNWAVSVPEVQSICDQAVTFKYIDHQVLSRVEKSRQKEITQRLMNSQNCDPQSGKSFAEIQNGMDFLDFSETQALLNPQEIKILCQRRFVGHTHGDLNPQNILICDNEIFLVDWDLCADGYVWSDGLSLVAHPHLDFSIDERIEFFNKAYRLADQKLARRVLIAYCAFKALRLAEFPVSDLKDLALSYQALSTQLKDL